MSELKPCPFCGGPVALETTIDGRTWFGVVCRNTTNLGGSCAVQIAPSATEQAAIKRWNTRNGETK
jgi:Lar family restriction alleviation protein